MKTQHQDKTSCYKIVEIPIMTQALQRRADPKSNGIKWSYVVHVQDCAPNPGNGFKNK